MDENEIQLIFQKEGITSDLSCSKAFEISESYQMTKAEIARYCNKHSVKIRGCQLGCFP